MAGIHKDNSHWILLIICNCILYGLCCLVIIKRKAFTYISIRSPALLLVSNFSNFAMTLILILCKIFDLKFISIFYYIFRVIMIVSILLRYERILACFKINMQKFYNKRSLLLEKFYVRLLLIIFASFFIVIMAINLIGINYFELFYLSYKKKNNELFKSQIIVWIIWNFIEQLLLITYIFRISKYNLKHILYLELYLFVILMLFYNNYTSFVYLYNFNNKDFTIISLIVLYICLIINGILPISMSLFSKINISYYFSPKLMNNLYLFLTNEECYKAFNQYLSKKGNNGSFYLKLYTHIMKFKLDLSLRINKIQLLNEANNIFNNYFSSENYAEQIDHEILVKVREKCQFLKINSFDKEMFDDGLQYVFNELNKRFTEYLQSNEFKELFEEINLYSFIQCKMFNTGLINKF